MSTETLGPFERYMTFSHTKLYCEECNKTITEWDVGTMGTNHLKKIKRFHRKECK